MNRHALLIANSTFPEFKALDQLNAPLEDLKELRRALAGAPGGGFQVHPIPNEKAENVINALTDLLRGAGPDDLVLIYYSGHGLTNDERTELSLATFDTTPERYPFKELKFETIVGQINSARPSRALIILDCCYSGAAGKKLEAKGGRLINEFDFLTNEEFAPIDAVEAKGPSTVTTASEAEKWKGIYLLTASTPAQRAWAGAKKSKSSETSEVWRSRFTEHLVNHCEEARQSNPPQNVTVHGLYSAINQRMKGSGQTPMLFCKGGQSDPDLVIIPRALPYEPEHQGGILRRWHPLTDAESSRLRQLIPVYLLDSKFNLKDWNSSFETIIGHQLHLTRGQHAADFLKKLDNWPEVEEVSLRDFKEPDIREQDECDLTGRIPSTYPPIHVERFEYSSRRFGLIVFDKLAMQISDSDGIAKTWCVSLNVGFVQRPERFWQHLRELNMKELQWSEYAKCYDEIIGEYPEYQKLLRRVVEHVASAENCLDVGAGTGNATVAILSQNERTSVTAIENNSGMLRRLISKIDATDDYRERTNILRGDALSHLVRLEAEYRGRGEDPRVFDGAVMLNVLFVLDDPVEVLKAVRRLLTPGAVLSLSNPRKGTDVDKLFQAIYRHLRESGVIEKKQSLWEAAYKRNKELMPAANRDSLNDIVRYLEAAGFEVARDDIVDNVYSDCVAVIKAVNPSKKVATSEPEK